MAAVYKSLSKANGEKADAQSDARKKNRQRVLILSSRGVTYRYGFFLSETKHSSRGYHRDMSEEVIRD